MRRQLNRNTLILPFTLAFCLTALFAWLFIPWLFSDKQTSTAPSAGKAVADLVSGDMPEHVFFSPRAHSRDACNECHAFSEEKYLEIFKLHKHMAGEADKVFYQTATLSMSECISCHVIPEHKSATTAGESCGTCHR